MGQLGVAELLTALDDERGAKDPESIGLSVAPCTPTLRPQTLVCTVRTGCPIRPLTVGRPCGRYGEAPFTDRRCSRTAPPPALVVSPGSARG